MGTVTFQPKQNLATGFSGTISAPHRGIHDASFDINYKFTNQNELDLDVNLQLEPGKMISIDIIYNSDGVQARLTSPMGSHRARARLDSVWRSVVFITQKLLFLT